MNKELILEELTILAKKDIDKDENINKLKIL